MLSHQQCDRAQYRRNYPQTACFSVNCIGHPGLLSRLIEPFAKRGLVLERLHAVREKDRSRGMTVDLQVSNFSPEMAEIVAQTLRQVIGVRTVLVSMKS